MIIMPSRSKMSVSWWTRFFAWLIDFVIVSIVAWLFFPNFSLDALHFGISTVLALVYWMVLDSEGHQSVGKKALGIRMVSEHGGNPDLYQAMISAFGKAFVLPVDVIVGVLAKPGKRQRLFNIVSNTVVVRE
jgi:uncharacterized RDD family membrane protein YckC